MGKDDRNSMLGKTICQKKTGEENCTVDEKPKHVGVKEILSLL